MERGKFSVSEEECQSTEKEIKSYTETGILEWICYVRQDNPQPDYIILGYPKNAFIT